MSKFAKLWDAVACRNEESFILSFDEIEKILGFSIDHSFLSCKQELLPMGCEVGKISMKNRQVEFKRRSR